MLNDFLKILYSENAKTFINNSINVLYDKNYPFCTYIGINYKNDELINVKFYVTAFKKVQTEQLSSFFPHIEQIKDAYNNYEEDHVFDLKHMGTAFIQKTDKNLNSFYSFYVKQKDILHKPIQKLKLIHTEPRIVDDYFALEINSNNPYLKRYYPIINRENINYTIDFFNIKKVIPEKIDYIEYLEYNDECKMTMAIKDAEYLNKYLSETNDNKFIELNQFIQKEYDLTPIASGNYYNSDVKSIYYMNKGDGINFKDSLTLFHIKDIINNEKSI